MSTFAIAATFGAGGWAFYVRSQQDHLAQIALAQDAYDAAVVACEEQVEPTRRALLSGAELARTNLETAVIEAEALLTSLESSNDRDGTQLVPDEQKAAFSTETGNSRLVLELEPKWTYTACTVTPSSLLDDTSERVIEVPATVSPNAEELAEQGAALSAIAGEIGTAVVKRERVLLDEAISEAETMFWATEWRVLNDSARRTLDKAIAAAQSVLNNEGSTAGQLAVARESLADPIAATLAAELAWLNAQQAANHGNEDGIDDIIAGGGGNGSIPPPPTPEPTDPEPEPTDPDPEPEPTDPEPTDPEPEPTDPDPEPEPTDPEPTDPEPEPTDPEPGPTDPESESDAEPEPEPGVC